MGLSINHNRFAPRLDGDFFEEDLPELLKTAPPKPTLNTIAENEALVFGGFGGMKGIELLTNDF
jgi:hypothetical protein